MAARVAIIADVRGWAFDAIAKGIMKYSTDPDLEFDLLYEIEMRHSGGYAAVRKVLDRYDLLWPFSLYQSCFVRLHGYQHYITVVHMGPLRGKEVTAEQYGRAGYVPCIQHCGGPLPDATDYNPQLYKSGMGATELAVISPVLQDIWQGARPDLHRLTVGIDPDELHPQDPRPAYSGPLRVGWVGNAEKGMKRFALVQEVISGMDGVELVTAQWNRFTGGGGRIPIPHEQMAEFFHGLDVYLCLSDHEGLPTPGIESAACGIPVVSTPVGVMPELIEDGVNGYLVQQDVDQIRSVLAALRDDRDRCAEMGQAMGHRMRKWYWPRVVDQWTAYCRLGLEHTKG